MDGPTSEEIVQFLVILFVILSLVVSFGKESHRVKIFSVIHWYLLLRFITGYRKCNFTYVELKLRGLKKKDYNKSFFYRYLNAIYDLRSLWLKIPEIIILYNINKSIESTK